MTAFVDSSVWFAATVSRDRRNRQAKRILNDAGRLVTTDHVLVETWLLLSSRHGKGAANRFWEKLFSGFADVEMVRRSDLDAAWAIGEAFSDQGFSIVDRTSFAVMERLGLTRAASFDSDFSVYRYGPARDLAFEILH